MSVRVIYPYNPVGNKEECEVRGESHVINTDSTTYRVIVPELTPFFKQDLVITHFGTGRTLVEGIDYVLAYRVLELKVIAVSGLYGSIIILNHSLKGEFLVDYKTIGGEFVGVRSEVLTYLANCLHDPVRTPWEQVLGRPPLFTPAAHEQDYSDFVNKETFAQSLNQLANSLDIAMDNADDDAIYFIENKIHQLDQLLDQYRIDLHKVDTNNPHATTAVQANALPATSAASDTVKAYGKTLVELAQYINSRGITQTDLDRYLSKYGDQRLSGKLTLANGNAIIKNDTSTASINLVNEDVTLTADRVLTIFSDYNKDGAHTSDKTTLAAGNNVLSVVTKSNNLDMEGLKYNNQTVLHAGIIADKLKNQVMNGMQVVTANTPTATITGTSRKNSPLKITALFPVATLTARGTIKISNSKTANSTTTAPSSYVLSLLRQDIEKKLAKTDTLNEVPYGNASSFNFTKTMIGLGNVDNTSDANKPVSVKQQELLNLYSPKVHKHDLSGGGVDRATQTTPGVVRLINDFSKVSDETDVATPFLVDEAIETIMQAEGNLIPFIPTDALDLKYWEVSTPVECEGFIIKFPYSFIFINRRMFWNEGIVSSVENHVELAKLFPTDHKNNTFYIYVEMVNVTGMTAKVVYTAYKELQPLGSPRQHIATIKTTSTGIANVTAEMGTTVHPFNDNVNGVLSIEPITSVGEFQELTKHENDPKAHNVDRVSLSPEKLGLDKIQNFPVANAASSLSDRAFLEDWDITMADYSSVKNSVEYHRVTTSNTFVSNPQPLLTWSALSSPRDLKLVNKHILLFNKYGEPGIPLKEYVSLMTVDIDLSGHSYYADQTVGFIVGSYTSGNDLYEYVVAPVYLPTPRTSLRSALFLYKNGIRQSQLTTLTYTYPKSYSGLAQITYDIGIKPITSSTYNVEIKTHINFSGNNTPNIDINWEVELQPSSLVVRCNHYTMDRMLGATRTLLNSTGYVTPTIPGLDRTSDLHFGFYVQHDGSNLGHIRRGLPIRLLHTPKKLVEDKYVTAESVARYVKSPTKLDVDTAVGNIGTTLPSRSKSIKVTALWGDYIAGEQTTTTSSAVLGRSTTFSDVDVNHPLRDAFMNTDLAIGTITNTNTYKVNSYPIHVMTIGHSDD